MDLTLAANPTEKELFDYITNVDLALESENSRFVYGDGVYVGSKKLREFYKGKQWQYAKDDGGAMRTYNYCFTIVENMTAFLANETPESLSNPRDVSDPIERVRSEGITKFIGEIHRINKFPLQFQKGVRVGSITGVSFLFGPIWDAESKTIRYWNIENPENIRPIWRDDNFTEMIGFVNRYRMNLNKFVKVYAEQLKSRGIDPKSISALTTSAMQKMAVGDVPSYSKETGSTQDEPMVEVKEYYDDEYYQAQVIHGNGTRIVIDHFDHNYGFVPGYWIPNIHLPGEAKGTSDIENVLDSQIAYNETKSNEEDIIRQIAVTQLWGKNLDNYSVINTGSREIYNFNDEATLEAMPRSENPFALESFERGVQGDIINLSGQNQALYPGGVRSILASTGRALSVMMQGINNKVSLRKTFWSDAIETLNRNTLILASQKIAGAKDFIDGNYTTSVFISSVLLRDVTEEVNKFNAKLQSMTTTQKNLGIPSPSEEQKLMKEELKDPIFGVEIARQPGLLQAVLQEMMQKVVADQAAAGGGGEENPALAVIGDGETPQPAATPGQGRASATSADGAVRAAGQRSTGVPLARKQ